MKVFDIVFSPTGGTEKVSNYIANALEGETVAVDLTDSGLGFRAIAMTKEDLAVIAVPRMVDESRLWPRSAWV